MVGRVEERVGLESAYGAEESEFVAVYGRRRVGKTYLVSETFRGKFSFRHAGLKDATMREQLESFRESLADFGHSKCPELKGWLQAFRELEVLLSRKKSARKVVFTREYAWRGKCDGDSREDAQIDLVLDRNDDTVNLCEMKYCAGGYRITASEDAAMARRKRMYSEFVGSKKALHVTFVTSDGLVHGKYNGNVQSEVTLDDLFRP